ncbi:MAG TPA: hypothetical protein ENK48_05065 [Gammaproteobacteria bacterium]|nr:hypothetical protein [Gammaproteobacteria bacterium]
MMQRTGIIRAAILVTVVVLAVLGFFMMAPDWQRASPCDREAPPELAARHPALQALLEKQRRETEQLLNSQRAQDVLINMQMSSRQISPEEALRLSTRQVEVLAALRRRQKSEFSVLCRRLLAQGD